MIELQQAVLGETTGDFVLEDSAGNRLAVQRMVEQCTRALDVASRTLDPPIFEDAQVLEALRQLALRSRHSRIRLMVARPEALVGGDHRILELARRLSSFIQLRVPAEEDADFNESLLLADECGFIRRPVSERWEGAANFSDRPRVTELRRRFEAMWERGQPDPNFTRLHL